MISKCSWSVYCQSTVFFDLRKPGREENSQNRRDQLVRKRMYPSAADKQTDFIHILSFWRVSDVLMSTWVKRAT